MPVSALRVALAGYGLAGEVLHAPLVAAEPGLELATVVTSDLGRAARVRDRYPGVTVAGSFAEVGPGHDLAVVAAPNRAHVELGLAALARGMHAVVDKPLAALPADGRALDAAAQERGLMLAVFHNRRFDGDFLTVRRLLADGALGDVRRFESRFERWRPTPREDAWRERGDHAEAGGVLFDLGSHLIDQALLLFGPVDAVYAELDRRRAGVEVDDDAFVALTHVSGVRSHLWMSQVAAQAGPRMRVLGSRAAYVKRGLDAQEDDLRAGRSPADPAWGSEPPERWGRLGDADHATAVPTEPGSYPSFYRGVVQAIREGTAPPTGAAAAIAGLEVIQAARASAKTGQVVKV